MRPSHVASVLLSIVLGACASTDPVPAAPTEVPEIAPGILQGYIPRDEQLDSLAFVPPAPEPGSPRQAMDEAIAARMVALRGTPRWDLATRDANLHFPAAAEVFECSLGIPVSEEHTPHLYMLLRRTLADLGLSTYTAKNHYQRQRPFMVNGEPQCTPAEEDMLRHDGSYPSGHTAIGWGWALILSEIAPERAEVLLARGRAYGESRNVCNVHWRSDVTAGRLAGAAAVAKLHSNDEFLAALALARADVERAREESLTVDRDCEAEAGAMSGMTE